jgi:hypothetical protein
MTRFQIVIVGCALVAVVACGASVTTPSQGSGLRLTGRISASEIAPGGTATFTFQLENLFSRPITLTFTSGCQVMPYITARQTGDFAYPSRGNWVCTTVMTSLDLPAFGSVTKELQIKAAQTADYPYVALAPGQYLAYAKLEQGANSIQSDPVSFTVH